jgi:hypothetical protein
MKKRLPQQPSVMLFYSSLPGFCKTMFENTLDFVISEAFDNKSEKHLARSLQPIPYSV